MGRFSASSNLTLELGPDFSIIDSTILSKLLSSTPRTECLSLVSLKHLCCYSIKYFRSLSSSVNNNNQVILQNYLQALGKVLPVFIL